MFNKIGKSLKVERIKKDMTVEDAAHHSGLSTVTIYKVEKGYPATISTLRKYAELFNKSIKITLE